MSTQAIQARLGEPTLASTWQAVAGSPITDELLEWPPDVFALTAVILERAEAYRFVLSPPDGVLWPPGGDASWSSAVGQAARRWSAWVEDRDGLVPELVAESGLSFGSGSRSRSKIWPPGGTGWSAKRS